MTEQTPNAIINLDEMKAELEIAENKAIEDKALVDTLAVKLSEKRIVAQEALDASTAADAHAAECVREALKHQEELNAITVEAINAEKALLESNQTSQLLRERVKCSNKTGS